MYMTLRYIDLMSDGGTHVHEHGIIPGTSDMLTYY